jgi:putative nucleotidyltransferase with HDIG domain
MSDHKIIDETIEYVDRILKENFKPENIYHNRNHTKEVAEVARMLGEKSGFSAEQMEIVTIAAWFHDVGYIETVDNHEDLSAKMASEFLESKNYPKEKIERVRKAILATKMPQNAETKIGEVLCDADLHHLGTKEFFDKNELFRVEMERRWGKNYSDSEWLENTLDFFTKQSFYSKAASKLYDGQKEANLLKLQKQYRKKLKKDEEEQLRGAKLEFEKEKLKKKKGLDKKAERGVETMFRNVMRTHISLSAMADNKANIMISVNTLLLGAIATLLAGKLDANPHLIIPTIVLSAVSLTTLIYAVLVTRPTISSGTFTKVDIQKKDTNLLFFGNFFNMNLQDFTWGMNEMMNDKDYLYGSMIKDFYFLGQVLGRKYKRLRICYNIFMFGMIVSVVLFIIFVLINPNMTDL